MRPSQPTRYFARRRSVWRGAGRGGGGGGGAGGLSAGDEHALGVGQRGGGRPGIEAAVQRDIARCDAEPVELAGGRGQQRVFAWVAELGSGGEQQAAGAAAGVLGDLGE